jgi:Flp pilus assembly pilin Flp
MITALTLWFGLKDRVAGFADRAREEIAQDFIEYALILGVITLVIIFAFLTTGIETAITDLSEDIQCAISGNGRWNGTGCA